MNVSRPAVLILSNFNVSGFCAYANNDLSEPQIDVISAPAAQLYARPHELGPEAARADFAVVWTLPELVIASFNQFLDHRLADLNAVFAEVDDYCAAVRAFTAPFKCALLPTWVVPTWLREPALLDLSSRAGISSLLMRMNMRLCDHFADSSRIFVLNSSNWVEHSGKYSFNPKLWHLAKIPFGNDVFKSALKDIKSAINALTGRSKKIIIVDLDDTLWGGVLGEVGWENLKLGGHDPVGEGYVDFQRQLKRLANRGILLAIVSKNEEALALEAIGSHPEMQLKIADFAGYRINWQDKAQNIADLLRDLNLLDSAAVFIDDNPHERDRIRSALPAVLTPDWPSDPMLFSESLLSLRCFDTLSLTHDDRRRTELYHLAQQAERDRQQSQSLEEWIASLQIKIKAEPPGPANLPRVVQLLNKTNQMNLCTRRMTGAELMAWLQEKNHKMWAIRVADKFGDSGLVGIVSLSLQGDTAQVADFLLSCRVLGRRIEEAMFFMAAEYAKAAGCRELRADFIPTAKNQPCLAFWQSRPGIVYQEQASVFSLNLSDSLRPVPGIKVVDQTAHDH